MNEIKSITNFKMFHQQKLILETYVGEVNADILIANKKRIAESNEYHSNYDILLDFRQADFNFSVTDLEIIVEYLKNNKALQGNKNVAYLTNKPNQVALTTMFASRIKSIPIRPKVFSTISAALNYLNIIGLDKPTLESLINETLNQADTPV